MTISWILLNLTAAAVLLIWAVRMVQTGVQRTPSMLSNDQTALAPIRLCV